MDAPEDRRDQETPHLGEATIEFVLFADFPVPNAIYDVSDTLSVSPTRNMPPIVPAREDPPMVPAQLVHPAAGASLSLNLRTGLRSVPQRRLPTAPDQVPDQPLNAPESLQLDVRGVVREN